MTEAGQRLHLIDGNHRHDEQDHGDDWAGEGFHQPQNARVDDGGPPDREEHQGDADFVRLGQRQAGGLGEQAFEAFTGTEEVAEEGGADGDKGDERPQSHDHRVIGDVGEIGEHRDVLGLGFGQLGWREAQHAGEDEKQHEAHQHHCGVAQDQAALGFCLLAIFTTLHVGKAGDGCGVAEGEHGDRQRQPDGVEEAAALQAAQLWPLPLRDQVAGERRQNGRERIDHKGEGAQHRLLTRQHHGDHGKHQHAGEHHPIRGCHA